MRAHLDHEEGLARRKKHPPARHLWCGRPTGGCGHAFIHPSIMQVHFHAAPASTSTWRIRNGGRIWATVVHLLRQHARRSSESTHRRLVFNADTVRARTARCRCSAQTPVNCICACAKACCSRSSQGEPLKNNAQPLLLEDGAGGGRQADRPPPPSDPPVGSAGGWPVEALWLLAGKGRGVCQRSPHRGHDPVFASIGISDIPRRYKLTPTLED